MATEIYRPGLKRPWFSLAYDEPASSADLYLYDDIGMWGISANDVKEQVLSVNPSRINVYINSNGGEIDDGLAIYNMLKRHDAEVVVYVDGIAASMASVIAMAGDKVVMPETALMFVHKPWTITAGNAEDLQRTAEQLDKWEAALVAAYAEKTGLPSATISDLLKDEKLLSASEAIELGFADEMQEASDSAFAFRGAITTKVLCHMARRVNKETVMDQPVNDEVIEQAPAEQPAAEVSDEAETAAVEQPVQPAADEPATEPVDPEPVDARAEFKQFLARFGDARAASYYAEGLSFADAERRFTDELIEENEALKGRIESATDEARPVALKPADPVKKLSFDEAYAAANTPAEKRHVYLQYHNKE